MSAAHAAIARRNATSCRVVGTECPGVTQEIWGGASLWSFYIFRTAERFPMNSRGSQPPGQARETNLPRRGRSVQPVRPHRHAEGAGNAHPAWGNPSGFQRGRREFRGCRSLLTTPPATHGKPLRGSNRGLTLNHAPPFFSFSFWISREEDEEGEEGAEFGRERNFNRLQGRADHYSPIADHQSR